MTIAIEPGHTLNVSQAKDFGTHTTKLQPKAQIAHKTAKMANLSHL